jgi:hypothetical protein
MQINLNDVLSVDEDALPLGAETLKANTVLSAIAQRAGNFPPELFGEKGIDCQLLSTANGGGFRQGRLRIVLDFQPTPPGTPTQLGAQAKPQAT